MIKNNSINLFKSLAPYILLNNKSRLIWATALSFVASLFEVFTIAALSMLIKVITTKTTDDSISITLNPIGNQINLEISVATASILFIFTIILSIVTRLFTIYYNSKLSAKIGNELSKNSFQNILTQSYELHINSHSSDIISTVTKHTDLTVALINQLFLFCSTILLLIGIIAGMIIVNPIMSCIFLIIYSIFYLIIIAFTRQKLLLNSRLIASQTSEQIKSVQEAIGSIKYLILKRQYNYYIKKYSDSDKVIKECQSNNVFVTAFPKFILEGVGIITLCISAIITTNLKVEDQSLIPTIGVIAIASQRLLSSMQILFNCWSTIKSFNSSIEKVLEYLKLKPFYNTKKSDKSLNMSAGNLPFTFKTLKLNNISIRRNNLSIINEINFEIKRGDYIGILGPSGSGKSTFLDLISGLLTPTSGEIFLNGRSLKTDSLDFQDYQSLISIVPQTIFLVKGSIASNIAFGEKDSDISLNLLQKSARYANLEEFIGSLPRGYKTDINELGSNLSGGQRQRIALARAFYSQCQIMVLDEATSALDSETEKSIINHLKFVKGDLTIISVSHKPATLCACDKVITMAAGKIIKVCNL